MHNFTKYPGCISSSISHSVDSFFMETKENNNHTIHDSLQQQKHTENCMELIITNDILVSVAV